MAKIPWIEPQYHFPKLPRLNTLRCPAELNRASGAGGVNEGAKGAKVILGLVRNKLAEWYR